MASFLPEIIDRTLEEGHALITSFNSGGTMLAIGCHDGRIQLFSVDVWALCRLFFGHVRPITSLQWSKNGRVVMSCCMDWCLVMWDVMSGDIVHKIRFSSALLSGDLHPAAHSAVVSPFMSVCALFSLFSVDGMINI